MSERCDECGSWDRECGNDKPVPDCHCARCLSEQVTRLQALERAALDTAKRNWDYGERLKKALERIQKECAGLAYLIATNALTGKPEGK